ncbi:TetR/AcrR family transcriptional regulator [Pseudonocardia sp. Cha107L01]|uniref:TetR/AcrR family transcriptional regulator n=1 Tax=Pseudonocardia sp. Cha107L01 TaxID=3457576 RepID=UPI00403EB43F
MRVDAARNVDAILRTGARLLAEDPSTSITAIAAEAGVSRRLVHRRFATREALHDAVVHTKLDAIDAVLADARLDSAPVAVALHRFVEGIISVVRRYPIDPEQMRDDAESYARILEQHGRIADFLRRAMNEGLIRTGLPDGMVQAQLRQIIALLAHQFPDHDPGKAADIAVDTLLSGMGRS